MLLVTILPLNALAAVSIADTLNVPLKFVHAPSTSGSFTYTVPAGTNQTLVVFANEGTDNTITGTQNGATITFSEMGTGCQVAGFEWEGILTAPTSGTFSISIGGTAGIDYVVFTVNNSDQTTPVDATATCLHTTAATVSNSITPPSANDLLIDWLLIGAANNGTSHGAGQTEYANFDDSALLTSSYDSTITGSTTVSTVQGMSETWGSSKSTDFNIIAIKGIASAAATVAPYRAPSVNFY